MDNVISTVRTSTLPEKATKKRDWIATGFHLLFLACAMVGVLSVGTIGWFVFHEGLPAFQQAGVAQIIFGQEWLPPALFGIGPMIVASLISTFGAVIIGVPIAILTAVFLAELAPNWMANIVRPAVELLAGIPSVVYGFFGLVIIVPMIETIFNIPAGNTILAGIIVLAIMILPTVITISETSLRALPGTYKEAALALGASQIYTVFKVLIPAARSGIYTGISLGIARAIGETMAIIMVMGNAPAMPGSLLEPARSLTANIAMEMSYATGIHSSALYSTGIVLLVFIVLLNSCLLYMNRKRTY
ncbi:phosphate transport system permease protein [Psychromonas marina]|uniref:Phosphate transport system permease protein n=1 Tax=Psychromonas marina TaxID=88364 RepID=A0ABQ6E065_9GAMM|nr:phosphate ABC transporter permease subunit PstC [Psychromonas marina]GLS90798.1 phosphate transport system permease protein [Psychromonas marina]